jgi:NAD(P)-dependent dehydrogenase (short-subunit alcohol dehydrogenase family)
MLRSLRPFIVALTLPAVQGWTTCMPSNKGLQTAGKVVGGAAAVGAFAVWLGMNQDKNDLFTPEKGSLQGQTILITGGTSGLGLESAKRLAVGGAEVVLTSRSDSKGQAAVTEVEEYLKERGLSTSQVSYRILDLDNLSSVKDAANWVDLPKIDVLLNNAGVMAIPQREITVDGYERQIQSNHLGHFVLTKQLLPKLSEKARIINVSSTAHTIPGSGGLDLDYFWTGEPGYGAWKSYGQSKLANILFTQELQRRIDQAGLGWTAVTLHPGTVNTDLGRHLFGEEAYNKMKQGQGSSFLMATLMRVVSLFLKTPEQGATTEIWLAAGEGDDVAAKYFVDCKPRSIGAYASDVEAARRLWEQSEQKSGIEFKLEPVKIEIVQ